MRRQKTRATKVTFVSFVHQLLGVQYEMTISYAIPLIVYSDNR